MQKFIALFFVLLCAVGLNADGLESLNEAGATAQTTVVQTVTSWRWLIGMVPLLVAAYATWKVKEHLEQKDEQSGGQTEPKISRYLKLVVSFIGGTVITYIVMGIFGKVFAKKSFEEMWNILVVGFWEQIFK